MANPLEQVARELRDALDRQHAARVSEALGCPVVIVRREQERAKSGRYLGAGVPVFAVPVEFLEQAQMLGLRAEAV